MNSCSQCGHQLDEGRFCTQCGAPVGEAERVPAGVSSATVVAPARSLTRSPARFPLFAETPDETVVRPQLPSLSETAVAPAASPAAEGALPAPSTAGPAPAEATVTDRVAAAVKQRLATADPNWLTSFGVAAGVLVAMLVIGILLVLI